MAEHVQTAHAAHVAHVAPIDGAPAHGHANYVKIWAMLLALLGVSIVGPFFGMLWLTLVTAFGIAVVKAVMVAAYFMHLNVEKTLIRYMLLAILGLVLVLWAGVYPDVQKSEGQNWRQADKVIRHTGDAPGKH